MTVNGLPILARQILRLRSNSRIDEVYVATSTSAQDDEIEALCKQFDAKCYRGLEADVLGRVSSLASGLPGCLIVEALGDSPLLDPSIIDLALDLFATKGHESAVVLNTLTSTFPAGMEVHVYSSRALLELDKLLDSDDPMREHVSYNFRRFPQSFELIGFESTELPTTVPLNLELDEQVDFELMSAIYSHFDHKFPGRANFSLGEIIEFLSLNPVLASTNSHIHRRWRDLDGLS